MNNSAIIQILLNSLKQTWHSKVWRWLFGSFSTLLAVILLWKNVFSTTVIVSLIAAIIATSGIAFCIFLTFCIINSLKYLHEYLTESRYGNAIILLKEGFAKIHAYRQNPIQTDEDFMKIMVYICDKVKKAFTEKCLCDCSVSIKVPVKGMVVEGCSVKNLCRDRDHQQQRDTANYQEINHTIIGNTAFRKVLNNVLRKSPTFAYLNNSINETRDYDNTSRDAYPDKKLPYNSEIVVPIIPADRSNNRQFETLGFLCVDCKEKDKFFEKYDVPLLEGVADGIYDVLLTKIQ